MNEPTTCRKSPYLSNNEMDQFDKKMNSIMQSSISTMFRQLIEPVDSNSSKIDIDTPSTKTSPPPLKLHDFGGSDFVRLAEKSRRNRSSTTTTTSTSTSTASPQQIAHIDQAKPSSPIKSKQPSVIGGMNWNTTPSIVATEPSSTNHLQKRSDWKFTQECVLRMDNSEEKLTDGTATESLHHVFYPDGTTKYITKSTIVSSPSTTSSLSSLAESTKMDSPLKRLWHLVFD